MSTPRRQLISLPAVAVGFVGDRLELPRAGKRNRRGGRRHAQRILKDPGAPGRNTWLRLLAELRIDRRHHHRLRSGREWGRLARRRLFDLARLTGRGRLATGQRNRPITGVCRRRAIREQDRPVGPGHVAVDRAAGESRAQHGPGRLGDRRKPGFVLDRLGCDRSWRGRTLRLGLLGQDAFCPDNWSAWGVARSGGMGRVGSPWQGPPQEADGDKPHQRRQQLRACSEAIHRTSVLCGAVRVRARRRSPCSARVSRPRRMWLGRETGHNVVPELNACFDESAGLRGGAKQKKALGRPTKRRQRNSRHNVLQRPSCTPQGRQNWAERQSR
jgi:hypothetical protein